MRNRLTIITSLLLLIAVLIMGIYSAVRERRLVLHESLISKGNALVTSLSTPCLEALAVPGDPDHQRLDKYLAGLTDQLELDVAFATVIDDEGLVVSHTDPEQYGRRATEPFMLEAMAADAIIHAERQDEEFGDVMEFAVPLAIEKLRWGTLVVGLSAERVQAELRAGYLGATLSAFLIIGPLVFLLYQLYSRSIVRPVLALARGVGRVEAGDLETRVQVSGKRRLDELGELVDGFNAMVEGLRERERLKGELEVAHKLEQAHRDLARTHAELEAAHRDLTRVHEDLKVAQGQLIQAEKMAALGRLLAGVAHEINNPVNFLVQSLELLKPQLETLETQLQRNEEIFPELLEDIKQCLGIMSDGAERTSAIVRKLLVFSRSHGPRIAKMQVETALDDTLELLHYDLKGRIRVEKCYAEVGAVDGDPEQLTQVFMNLLSNAIQAIHGEGRITVTTACKQRSGSEVTTATEDWVRVEISDTGQGIAEEHLDRIFDPFFTTKEVGKGTGLGLALSYQIIQRHGGEIRVESVEGQGSVFTIELPREGMRS